MVRRETNRGFSSSLSTLTSLSSSLSSNPETVLFSEVIPAKKMGTGKKLRLEMLFTLSTAAISLPTLTVKIKLGSQTLTIANGLGLTASQTNAPFTVDARIRNKDDAGQQMAYARMAQNGNNLTLLIANSQAVYADMTVDTTQDQNLQVTAQFGGLSSGNTLTLRDVDMDLS